MEQVTFRPLTQHVPAWPHPLDQACRANYDVRAPAKFFAVAEDGTRCLAYEREGMLAIFTWSRDEARRLVDQHREGVEFPDLDAQEYDVARDEVTWNPDGSFTVDALLSFY
jgi:hypothetical protein